MPRSNGQSKKTISDWAAEFNKHHPVAAPIQPHEFTIASMYAARIAAGDKAVRSTIAKWITEGVAAGRIACRQYTAQQKVYWFVEPKKKK